MVEYKKNIQPTIGKMNKVFPVFIQDKKAGTNNKNYLYDFSLLRSHLPDDIAEEVQKQAMNDTSILNDFAVCSANSYENGKRYFIYIQFSPLKVNKRDGRNAYCIMQVDAFRISTHNRNIYGGYDEYQSDCIEVGVINESLSVIDTIEIS